LIFRHVLAFLTLFSVSGVGRLYFPCIIGTVSCRTISWSLYRQPINDSSLGFELLHVCVSKEICYI
jgi:hypothetical protein